MHRRWFTTLVAITFLVAPVPVAAQQPGKMYRIGVLSVGPPNKTTGGVRLPERALNSPFGPVVDGLKDLGWIDGQNIVFELRASSPDALADLAADLVKVPVDVIVVPNAGLAAIARRATTTIPIVVMSAGDLEGSGLVASLARPGGNVTGTQVFSRELIGKRLELLRQAIPTAPTRLGVLSENATMPEIVQLAKKYRAETNAASRALGLEPTYVSVQRAEEFEAVFTDLTARRAQAVLVYSTPFMFVNRTRLAVLALQHRLPSTFEMRPYADAGGLMSYGVDLVQVHRRTALFIDKIFKGAKAADLPVEQPTKFEFVINRATAKTLGLTIPQSLLLRADQVIK